VIGAVLLAHYQFGQPAMPAGSAAAVATAPASPEMLQLVRDEHDLIRNFLNAQQAAQAGRYAPADAQAAAEAEPAAAAARRAANAVAAKAPARGKPAATASLVAMPAPAAAVPGVFSAPQALPAVAGLQNSAVPPAAATPVLAPEHRSLMARIMSVKDHVVRAPLHAVMTIGGIPSWLGHRLGSDEPDPSEQMFSAAS
jgi:hypothetical protein